MQVTLATNILGPTIELEEHPSPKDWIELPIKNEWIVNFHTNVVPLCRTCSDHSPLLITVQTNIANSSSFRFINAWTTHHQFPSIVKEAWETPVQG